MYTYSEYFTFTISNPDETDLAIVSVIDKRTNYTVRTALPNAGKQIASIMAFAGARFSRSDLSTDALFKEIREAKKTANEKLASIFRNYGHASVADMAQLFAYIENVPSFLATKFFNETSLGGGQERSTRYQDYGSLKAEGLEEFLPASHSELVESAEFQEVNTEFKDLQSLSMEHYSKYKTMLTSIYTEVYKVNIEDKKQLSALSARVFDTARYHLPSGVCHRTSLCWITSAREWARIISQFKASKIIQLQYLAEQLEVLFSPEADFAQQVGYTPEAPDLIRYTEADETIMANNLSLEAYLNGINFLEQAKLVKFGFKPVQVKLLNPTIKAGTKALAQVILTLYPTVDEDWLIGWVENLPVSQLETISQILLQGYNHHKQMGNQFRINTHTFILDGSIAEGRDLNRHRAWGRFVPLLASENNYTDQIDTGYTLPLYLVENPVLQEIKSEFEADLLKYYSKLQTFKHKIHNLSWFPGELFVQLLPFAHNMKMWMHGSIKEISYMTYLRVRPGGHINYRRTAYLMATEAAKSEPLLRGLTTAMGPNPDACSNSEFIDRS